MANSKWVLTIGKGILEEFPNKKCAIKYVTETNFIPFHLIDKDHYLMGNVHLLPKSRLKYIDS